jgi:hypothetical protein
MRFTNHNPLLLCLKNLEAEDTVAGIMLRRQQLCGTPTIRPAPRVATDQRNFVDVSRPAELQAAEFAGHFAPKGAR